MTACLKITWLVFVYLLFGVFVLFYFLSAMCRIPIDMSCLHWAQNLETKKQPRMALKETQSGQPKPSEGTLIVFLGLQLPRNPENSMLSP